VRVEVPPIYVLKKQYPPVVGATPTSGVRSSDGWGPAGGTAGTTSNTSPMFRASTPKTFTVPAGGMRLVDVAREALGNASRWQEIYNLNPQVTPDNVPAGTVLMLPDPKPAN
jgi:nucleoid-associated protein YgaU